MDDDRVKQLIGEALNPVSEALKQLNERLGATTPAATPAAPVAPAAPSPESAGDASVAQKQVVLDQAGIGNLVEEIFKRMPGNPQGVVPQGGGSAEKKAQEQRVGAQTALVDRVKKTNYSGPGVEAKWEQHALDAVAIELLGRDFDDLTEADEIDEP